jgi:hypothetical protein
LATGAHMKPADAATVDALCGLVMASPLRTLAVIGLVKNAGKTTVVNALLANCSCKLGLTSLGLDGEPTDHVTGLAKPRITPPAGTLVATTRGSLERSRSTMDILEELPFRTPLGPVVIGRASGRGRVEVSGPTTLAELQATVERLYAHGACRVLVDGAINRLGSGSPRVSDGLLLATGGMAGETLEDVVENTVATLDHLSLPEVSRQTRELLAPHLAEDASMVSFDAHGCATPLALDTAVGAGATVAREAARLATATLFVSGALTEGFLDELARVSSPQARLRIVVRDATVLVAPARSVQRCRGVGISLEVLTPLRVLAVTANPFRRPHPYQSATFFGAIVDAIGDRVPVFDVLSALSSVPSGPRRPQDALATGSERS